MVDLQKFLTEVPLSVSDKERKVVEDLILNLHRNSENGSKGLIAVIEASHCPTFHLVLCAGLRALDEGLITFTDPPKSRHNPPAKRNPSS